MVSNCYCEQCIHGNVCEYLKILAKFDNDAKGFIGIDITMDACANFDVDASKVSDDDTEE